MKYLCGCTAAAVLALGVGVAAQAGQQYPPKSTTPGMQDQARTVTIEGCLQREQDVPGRKPNVAERAGVMEDYILTSAKVVKGAAGAPGATEPKPGETATGTAGTQQMYDVKGLDDEKLKPLVGQRVQIEGTLADVTPSSKPPAGATASTADLPDIRGTVIRQVSGECPPKK